MAPIQKLSLLAVLLTLTLQVSSQGTQFITGACTSDAICASGCCGFNSGKCAGPIIAQERDGGCGFGDAQPNDRAAQLLRGGAATPSGMTTLIAQPVATATNPLPVNGDANVTPPVVAGTQFITGVCTSDAICASGCCGFNSGKCAGPIIAQERDGGCGFGDAQPNDRAAQLLRGGAATATNPLPVTGDANVTPPVVAGTQFITGVCTSDAICASKCCGFNSGKCAGPIVAQERDGGCGFGNAVPNDDAARALTGKKRGLMRRFVDGLL